MLQVLTFVNISDDLHLISPVQVIANIKPTFIVIRFRLLKKFAEYGNCKKNNLSGMHNINRRSFF